MPSLDDIVLTPIEAQFLIIKQEMAKLRLLLAAEEPREVTERPCPHCGIQEYANHFHPRDCRAFMQKRISDLEKKLKKLKGKGK